jgi:SagB-type dehydrogenase family enzyme
VSNAHVDPACAFHASGHSRTDVAAAACILLLTSDLCRPSFTRYGGKQYRLVLLEAGHLAQNILLVAAGLGLGALSLCGFADQALAEWVGLDYPRQVVLYAIAIGTPDPAEAGRPRRDLGVVRTQRDPAGPSCAF